MSNRGRLVAASLLIVLGSAQAMVPERVVFKQGESDSAARLGSPHARLLRFLMQPVEDPNQLRGFRIAILATDGVDGFDLDVAQRFLAERGAVVHVLVPRTAKDFQAAGSGAQIQPDMQITVLDPSGEEHTAAFDHFVDQVQPCEYDLVYLPSNLTFSDHVAEQLSVAFLQQTRSEGKPIFAMGNAVLVLFNAGLIDNRTARADQATVNPISPPPTVDEAGVPSDGLVHAGRDAFDMPVLMDELMAALRGRTSQKQ
jgi:putative intracellular protease/amidase